MGLLNKVELTEKELTAMKARALIAATLLAAAALVTVALPARAAWDHPHGDSANTGFAKVLTTRAVQPMQFVPVGELSSGAGPVTAPDGTVYVGNVFGQLLAFDANGTPAWSRQLPSGQWITSSPVLGADGSVYVVSETRGLIEGSNSDFFYESTLHKFTPGGDLLFQAPFPQHSGISAPAAVMPTRRRISGEVTDGTSYSRWRCMTSNGAWLRFRPMARCSARRSSRKSRTARLPPSHFVTRVVFSSTFCAAASEIPRTTT